MPLPDSKEGRDFQKLVMWVSSLSIAVMAALLASLKQVNPDIELRFTIGTVIAFIAGGVLTALFLRGVMRADKKRRVLLVLGAAITSVLVYFLIGIDKTSRENRADVTIGTLLAVMVLSFVAFLLWRLSRFIESGEPKDGEE